MTEELGEREINRAKFRPREPIDTSISTWLKKWADPREMGLV